MRGKEWLNVSLLLAGACACAAAVTGYDAAASDSFKGKVFSVIVGFSTGGAYDLYARVLSGHMGQHLPGAPKLIVQNMPGAGGLKAAGYLYDLAPKDGTTFGTFARGNIIGPLLGQGKFDPTKFNWVGSVTDDVNVCLSWHTSKIKTMDDVLTKPFVVAGQGPEADPNIYAALLHNLFHAPIKIVNGYPGSMEIGLAMERGEVDGVCALSFSTIKSTFADKLNSKQFNILFQAGLKKSPDLPDVPLLLDKARNDEQRQILKLVMGVQAMARPFAAPPGVPPKRIAMLRDAFASTMADPKFLKDARIARLDVNPSSGETVAHLVDDLYATPQEIVAKTKSAISQQTF